MVQLKKLQKGFTLIELLIVIAILAILAAAVIAAIDPVDKINAANDSKVQADIAELATAEESYAVNHNGAYLIDPGAQAALVSDGELKHSLTPPPGYSYTIGGSIAAPVVSSPLKSKKYTATPFWVWAASNGKACANGTASACP